MSTLGWRSLVGLSLVVASASSMWLEGGRETLVWLTGISDSSAARAVLCLSVLALAALQAAVLSRVSAWTPGSRPGVLLPLAATFAALLLVFASDSWSILFAVLGAVFAAVRLSLSDYRSGGIWIFEALLLGLSVTAAGLLAHHMGTLGWAYGGLVAVQSGGLLFYRAGRPPTGACVAGGFSRARQNLQSILEHP